MDIRRLNVGNLGEFAAKVENELLADADSQSGLDTLIEVTAITFDIEHNQVIAKTLQTDIHGSSYVDIKIDTDNRNK